LLDLCKANYLHCNAVLEITMKDYVTDRGSIVHDAQTEICCHCVGWISAC